MRKDFIAQTLKWLSWKKWVIATIITLIIWYLFAKWYIQDAEYQLIWWLLVIMFWWASIATKNIYSVNK
jgi:hypothetical protein